MLIVAFPFSILYLTSLSFLQMAERVSKEAKRSHKDKVDAFNEHLSSLSEHHDIPKVSFFVEAYDNLFLFMFAPSISLISFPHLSSPQLSNLLSLLPFSASQVGPG